MRKTLATVATTLVATVLLPMAPAHADLTCRGDDVLTPITGPGPQADKDRDGDLWICVKSGYRGKDGVNYFTRYYDDI